MRVALIGPVPPALGGFTPGGVATHQVHLAAGLAEQGAFAPLLATNTRVPPSAWRDATGEASFPMYRMGRPLADLAAECFAPKARSSSPPDRARFSSEVPLTGERHVARFVRRLRTASLLGGQKAAGLGEYAAAVGALRVARYAAYLATRPADGSRREMLWNLLWYRRFLAEVRPDVIHVQHPLDRFSDVRLVKQLEGWNLPVVVTAHSLFGEHAPETIEQVMGPNLRRAERVIAVSEHIAQQAISLGVDPGHVRVIRSGVDVQRYSTRDRTAARSALGVDQGIPMVLFVGNLEPRKQVDVLLHALAQVRREIGEALLVLVGSGESAGALDQTRRLTQLTQELSLTGAVRFAGRVDDRRLLQYYAAADVFALPSSSEAQGIVALEAMACGLPVLASAVGGLLGTIEDGVSGLLVPPGDPAALAHGLVILLQNEDRREVMGAAARARVERDFSWPRAVEATLAVYQELVPRR